MKLTITIDMGNAAFDLDNRLNEVQRILGTIAGNLALSAALMTGGVVDCLLSDHNGNHCGSVRVEE